MIIYPPIIGNTIPAFTDVIKVPFTQNPTVGKGEVDHMVLTIRDISNNEVVVKDIKSDNIIFNNDAGTAEFKIDFSKLIVAQWYKLQIAYGDTTQENNYYYSSVATGRYLGIVSPELKIEKLEAGILNTNLVEYTGSYKTSIYSEPIYQYRFIVKIAEEVIEDTDWVLHDSSRDEIIVEEEKEVKFSQDNFYLRHDLKITNSYTITYSIKTINGWESSVTYNIQGLRRLPSMFAGSVIADQASSESREYGYVDIKLSGDTSTQGSFILYRTQDNETWDQLGDFTLSANSILSNFSWKDFTVEQGVTYTYAIAQKAEVDNVTYISERILSKPVTANFEHTYLGDGERQLVVKFNPQVSSFKDTILESKTDTIGGKYPFFFRNGKVRYKEIPISGLLSYQLDEAQFFISDEELGLEKNLDSRESTSSISMEDYKGRTTQLVDYNIAAERKFKLAVNEWLTNGEPKLFRSPTEGNYVVRLMNVSLSPNATVGRMLHTFSATGYQIADSSYEVYKAKGFDTITPDMKDPDPAPQMITIVVNNGVAQTTFDNYEYITDLTYIAYTNLLDGYFTIKSENSETLEFRAAQGVVTLPTGKYSELSYGENLNGTFIISYIPKQEAPGDDFAAMISTTEDGFVTLTSGTKTIPKIYYLVAQRNSDEIGSVTINDNKIILQAGVHTYEDLPYNTVISDITNTTVTIYGRLPKGGLTNGNT